MQDGSRNPQVNEEVPPALERDNQILASPTNVGDAFALERSCHELGRLRPRQPGIEDHDPLDPLPRQPRREPGADRLDLWQLRHRRGSERSGEDVEDDRPPLGRLAPDAVAAGDLGDGPGGGLLVVRMHLGNGLVLREMVRESRRARVHLRAAERLLVGLLARRHLHERRAREEDARAALHHHLEPGEARFERATEPQPLKDRALELLSEGGNLS